ncbi:MAG TPA: zinc metalloprotease HtpX [Sulfurovum sp.]|jgi:heat shock protein HtpX|nr:MAG: protease [Sulfurovum sp. 35-42-20]OYY57611.1 MAG: protease [Sulfurovum sp. 28-43-6]OYZ25348.1 MAG: protease [Sulfurovum sp. 16-42-52]OYZ48675.1 MAG: protease [Sulfurovum sp. 24-42-9]OZA46865.1 MAG: protease [Sulfurovum sp. 17-42-90]OZA61162.1 MAG: protease [Sulfurovum sp. 39-42-12]HQR74278.1 zinc metalloprotease HtpX [Sulfurovum sp.]
MEQFKTYALMIGLTLIFIWFGGMIGGQSGMLIAFLVAAGMNFYAYYYSDTQVLKHYHALPVERDHATGLYEIVERLTQRADLPMPALYIIPEAQPNAFATGRDYEHAAVAVTEGLLDLMSEEEVEAVIAHELSHIKHYDMLIGTVTATIAGAIAMLANFGMFFGGDKDRPNPVVMIVLMILMPLAATIIQMTVSRNREFMADEGSARMTGHPEWLQSALSKLDSYARGTVMHDADPQTAHMFIINPFSGQNLSLQQLFSTHPSTEQRIARLEALK